MAAHEDLVLLVHPTLPPSQVARVPASSVHQHERAGWKRQAVPGPEDEPAEGGSPADEDDDGDDQGAPDDDESED